MSVRVIFCCGGTEMKNCIENSFGTRELLDTLLNGRQANFLIPRKSTRSDMSTRRNHFVRVNIKRFVSSSDFLLKCNEN